jgi:hypothetical protein
MEHTPLIVPILLTIVAVGLAWLIIALIKSYPYD